MKKVIGIYCGDFQYKNGKNWDSDVIRSEGAGGSETWAVELSSAFNRLGFHVIVFGNPSYWHFDKEGVEYVPYNLFNSRCQYQHFDYFISSRRTDEITPYLECHNIYTMSHEIGVFDRFWGNFANFQQLKMDKVKKIAVLSDWHLNETLKLYPELHRKQLFKTFNGIQQELYNNVDFSKKKNAMVWSTCLNRGLTFFGQRVLPKILEKVPDFQLYICSYNTDIHGIIPEGDNVHFLGTLNKNDLADLQKECKVWALANYGLNDFGQPLHESFCMTALENALAGNAIVAFNKDGITTTLEGYSNIINIDWFDEYSDVKEEDLEKLGTILSDGIIRLLKDDELRLSLAEEAKNISLKYTWDNSALTWLKEWGLRVI